MHQILKFILINLR